jgi:hypothetical protein
MRKLLLLALLSGIALEAGAQKISPARVPAAAKTAFMKAYPAVRHPTWEREDGNFEGNWKAAGQDHSAVFTPEGQFAGSEQDIDPATLPQPVHRYIERHAGAKIKEASVNEDSTHVKTYEADVKGKGYIFDLKGHFIKVTDGD